MIYILINNYTKRYKLQLESKYKKWCILKGKV